MTANHNNIKTYIVCATPRTGSTLLCAALKSSDLAGSPESYFRSQDKKSWAQKWGILNKTTNDFTFSDYLNAAIKAGSTCNNVTAMRIMWSTMGELVDDLKELYGHTHGKDIDYLTQAFGACEFIYLKREDHIAQAVSLSRALQTDLWHALENEISAAPAKKPHYDFKEIQKYVREAEEHNQDWENWFKTNNINPYRVLYEDLAKNPPEIARQIHEFLDIDLPNDIQFKTGNKRLSDGLSLEWIERYKSEMKKQ